MEPLTPFKQHYSAGLAHLEAGRHEKAAERFTQAAIADPEQWCDLARGFAKEGNVTMALGALRQVIRLHPDHKGVLAAAWCAMGNVLYDAGQTDEALKHFQTSWDCFHTAGASANIAFMHLRRGRLEEADKWIKISLEINHWNTEAQMIQSDINFQKGNYRTAFRQYECRWRARSSGLIKLQANKPEWPGPGTKGHVLIVGEQGMGDVILVLRYAKLIADLGLKQTWIIHPPLISLANTMGVPDADFIAPGDLPPYDYHTQSASLPRLFNTTIETIPPAPYIPLPQGYKTILMQKPIQIGLVWRGAPGNPNNAIRSTTLADWNPVLAVPGISFHSLQFGDGQDDTAINFYKWPLWRGEPVTNWLQTAELVSTLDLVISVDTAMVHLCGAMGVPCWCALHCRPYFVFPQCREDCPWYPSVRLFKQQREFEWKPVFEQIANELKKL